MWKEVCDRWFPAKSQHKLTLRTQHPSSPTQIPPEASSWFKLQVCPVSLYRFFWDVLIKYCLQKNQPKINAKNHHQHEKVADFSFYATWQNWESTEILLSTIANLTVYHALKTDMKHPLWHKTAPITTIQFSRVFPERPLEFIGCHLAIKKLENATLNTQPYEWWVWMFILLLDCRDTEVYGIFLLDKNTEYKWSTKNPNSIIANISAACKLPMLGCQYLFHQIGLVRIY